MTDAHVAALFDVYAPSFDDSLRGFLAYRAPERLMDAVRSVLGARRELDVLDLGAAPAWPVPAAALARRLEGIDLSTGMLEKARERGVTTPSGRGDHPRSSPPPRRVMISIVAVDVLVYFGALEPLFQHVARRLAPGGLFAFTVERAPSPGTGSSPPRATSTTSSISGLCQRGRPEPVFERKTRAQAGRSARHRPRGRVVQK